MGLVIVQLINCKCKSLLFEIKVHPFRNCIIILLIIFTHLLYLMYIKKGQCRLDCEHHALTIAVANACINATHWGDLHAILVGNASMSCRLSAELFVIQTLYQFYLFELNLDKYLHFRPKLLG